MHEIWKNPTEDRAEVADACLENHESKFIRAVADEVAGLLKIENWKDRRVFSSLLESALEEKMHNYLKQYLNSQIEILGQTFNREFGISVHPEYNYATHAKLDSHIQQILEHFARVKEPRNKSSECEVNVETNGRLKPKRRE